VAGPEPAGHDRVQLIAALVVVAGDLGLGGVQPPHGVCVGEDLDRLLEVLGDEQDCCGLAVHGQVHGRRGMPGATSSPAGGFAVVVRSDLLPLSTWLVAPTSTSARAATFRPEVEIDGQVARVLAEQTAADDPGRLRASAGHLNVEELRRVDAALRLVLSL
jgi:mRNA interferase MazF